MAYLKREDCLLYYAVYGTGEPFLLLHGNGEDGSYFEYQIAYFQQYYKVITMDMRGHGKSGFGNQSLNFDLFAEDVMALFDELKLSSAHILGFSDGGNTALTIALTYPSRVKSLIVNGADLHPRGVKRHIQIPIIVGYWILSFFAHFSTAARRKKEIMGLMVKYPNIKQEELSSIQQPALLIVGDRDMIREEHSRSIAEHMISAQFCILRGSHFIAHEHPEEFNLQVIKFLHSFMNA